MTAATQSLYEKEFMTCSICRKYKGCWTDSEVCSDCDEVEDERKMADNDEQEAQPSKAIARVVPLSYHGHEQRLLNKVRGLRSAVEGPFMFAGVTPLPASLLIDAENELAEFYAVIDALPVNRDTRAAAPDDCADLLAIQPTRYDYTAPPAEHGRRDLGIGLALAVIFCCWLSSCAAPARLPLEAGVKSAEHDNRTKLVEPYAVVPAKSVR